MITKQEFIAKVKTKYPEYKDIDDKVLYQKIIAKYPEYKDQIIEKHPEYEKQISGTDPRWEKAMDIPAKMLAYNPMFAPLIKALTGDFAIKKPQDFLAKPEQAKQILRGAAKGSSLGYLDIPGKKNILAELAGGFAPYVAVAPLGTAVKGAKILQAVPRLARIAGAAAPMAAVGALRPGSLQERAKQAGIGALLGGGLQAVGEAGKLAATGIKKVAPGILEQTAGVPREAIRKAMTSPKKYLKRPLSSKEELKVITRVKDKAVKNMDDLFNFRVETLENSVAKQTDNLLRLGGRQNAISASTVKREISKYVNEMMDAGVIDRPPPALNKLYATIDRYAYKGASDVTGKLGKVLSFGRAHKLKQTLYKIIGKAYGKGNFDDVVAGAYKRAAKNLNVNLRKLSPDYAKANDQLSGVYKLYDEIGTKGTETFIGKGATKRFRSMLNDPEGRLILKKLEAALPQKKRGFMNAIDQMESSQAIKRSFQEPRTGFQNLPFLSGGGVGGMTYLTTRNLPLAALAGGTTAAVSSPRMLRSAILGTTGLGQALAKIPQTPRATPLVLQQMLQGR